MRDVASIILLLSLVKSIVCSTENELSHYEECKSLLASNRFTAAVRACMKAAVNCEDDDEKEKSLLALAKAHENDASPWLALGDLKRLVEDGTKDDNIQQARHDLAILYTKFGDFEAAKSAAIKVKDEEKQATLLKSVEKAEKAWKSLEEAADKEKWNAVEVAAKSLTVDLTPYFKAPYDVRIKALLKMKDYQRAIDAARSKSRIETDSSETDFLIGKIYFSMGNASTGYKYVTSCAQQNPENRKCLSLRSKYKDIEATLKSAETDMLINKAIEVLKDLLKQIEAVPETEPYYDPSFPVLFEGFRLPVMKLLCGKLVRKKLVDEATEVCSAAQKLDSANPDFYLVKQAELAMANEKYDDALDLLKQARAANPKDAEIRDFYQKVEKKKMEKMRTKYYDLLGVSQGASADEIKSAYSKMVKKWHPDKHRTDEAKRTAEEKMQEINAAYDVLSDPKKKRMYDQGIDPNDPQGGAGGNPFAGFGGFPGGGFGGFGGRGGGGAGGFEGFDFAQFFQGAGGFGGAGAGRGDRARGGPRGGPRGGGAGTGRGGARRGGRGGGFDFFRDDL